MKLLFLALTMFSLLAAPSWGVVLTKGDVVKLDWVNSGPNQTYGRSEGGGEFLLSKWNGSTWDVLAKTFCLEYSEHISLNSNYLVGSNFSDRAVFGGVDAISNPAGDILNSETKYLYENFTNGSLRTTFASMTNDQFANGLQQAIWAYEGEKAVSALSSQALQIYNSATGKTGLNVFALNLFDINTPTAVFNAFDYLNPSTWTSIAPYKKQDQLYSMVPPPAFQNVPEPTSILVFGVAFLGFSVLRGRRKAVSL